MPQITLTVGKGAEVYRQGLERLRRQIPRISRQRIYKTLQKIVRIMKVYPAPPEGSTYVRTYKLRRNWRIINAGSKAYRMINRARFRGREYGKWVVGNARGEMQAEIHQGRWKLFAHVVEQEVSKMPKAVEAALKRVSKGLLK